MFYIFLFLLRHEFDVVQARNMDCLIPAHIARAFREFKVIYDVPDFYAESYARSLPVIRKLVALLELTLARKVNALILVSRWQVKQIKPEYLPSIVAFIYNVPFVADISYSSKSEEIFDIFLWGFFGRR